MGRHLRLSELFSSPRIVKSAVIYGFGLGLLLFCAVVMSHVDPDGVYGSSWLDPYEIPLLLLCFLICSIAPLFSPCRSRDRFLLFMLTTGGFLVWTLICLVVYIMLVQLFPAVPLPAE
ncbi:MAG: hypothetical protein ABI443_09840 [Chthoniobacterales bacterium]